MRLHPGQMLYHLLGYSALMRWLGGRALAWFWPRLILCGAVSVGSVAIEMLAFLLIINVLQASQIAGTGSDSRIASIIDVSGWHPILRVLVPVAVLSLASVLTYLGRSMAISLQGLFTKRLSDEVLTSLRERLDYFERIEPFGGYKTSDIVLILTNDSLACGLALRLVAYNLISVVYLLVGLAILAVLAPALLGLWCVSLLLVTPIVYLINLRGLRQARLLLELTPRRRNAVIAEVHTLLGGSRVREPDGDEIKTEYLKTMDGRLRLVELSRFSLSLVFAIAVAAFLWMAQDPDVSSIMNLGYLLLLFLAFRYTFQGFQGLSVLVTTINRNLPSMIRVHDISQRIAARAKRSEVALREVADDHADVKWRIDNPNAAIRKGQFALGQTYALIAPQPDGLDSIAQVYGMLAGRTSQSVFSRLVGTAPIWTTVTEARLGDAATASAAETGFSDQILQLEKVSRSGRATSGTPAEQRDQRRLETFAEDVHRLGERIATVVMLDGAELVRLAIPTQRAILKKLSGHLVFVVTNRINQVLANHPFDGALVSTGARIGLVLPASRETDEAMKQAAKAVFGSEQQATSRREKLAGELDDIEDALL